MKHVNLNDLLICRSLLDDTAMQELQKAMNGRHTAAMTCASLLIRAAEKHGISGNLLRGYILYRLAHYANLAAQTTEAQAGPVGPGLRAAFVRDMEILLPLLTSPATAFIPLPLLDDYKPTVPVRTEAAAALSDLLRDAETPEDYARALLSYYHCFGYGDIASYRAFRWDDTKKNIVGIRHFESIRMSDLIGYQHQKDLITGNTLAFIAGKPANNVLLVGARGTGKSSAVKALANEYYNRGLRLLQLTKDQLCDLPFVMDTLRKFASKYFIVFFDDLSFEENDAAYKNLKSAMEGGVESRPANVLIYATSNRRHLIRETWHDRGENDSEVHRSDSVNESISLSDRFGLIIQYYAPDQNEYLAIIDHMLKKAGVNLTPEELRVAGVRWEMTHSGRSGRTAEQFVADYLGQNKTVKLDPADN